MGFLRFLIGLPEGETVIGRLGDVDVAGSDGVEGVEGVRIGGGDGKRLGTEGGSRLGGGGKRLGTEGGGLGKIVVGGAVRDGVGGDVDVVASGKIGGVGMNPCRCGAETQLDMLAVNSKEEGDPSKSGTGDKGYELDSPVTGSPPFPELSIGVRGGLGERPRLCFLLSERTRRLNVSRCSWYVCASLSLFGSGGAELLDGGPRVPIDWTFGCIPVR